MYQIFYIDIDEEITSIIDRLRKSKTDEVYLVVPKRALVLQSMVSLKLLRKDGERLKKKIMIVTQDEMGKMRVEKSGIKTVASLEGLEEKNRVKKEVTVSKIIEVNNHAIPYVKKNHKINRILEIGSKEFYNSNEDSEKRNPVLKKIIHQPISHSLKENEIMIKKENEEMLLLTKKREAEREIEISSDNQEEEELEELFAPKLEVFKKTKKMEQTIEEEKIRSEIPDSGKVKKLVLIFLTISFLVVAGIVAFLLIPKAKIIVSLEENSMNVNFSVKASPVFSVSFSDLTIPARMVDKETSFTMNFSSTGKKSSSNQKARGTVTIYNEYNSSPQPLVATTRLLAQNGKLFRLTKGVVVPGMTKIGGNIQPGAIEAEVIADQAGSEYNIEPATFSIPGFEGSQKFQKFYAKSTKVMMGGGSNGSETGIISQEDINMAKNKTESEARKKIEEEIRSDLNKGEVFLAEMAEGSIIASIASARAGDVGETFEYKVSYKIKALVFSEEDLKNLIMKKLENGNDFSDMEISSIKIEYSQPSLNMTEQSVVINFNAKVFSKASFDAEKFKEDILGKSGDQVQAIIKKYSQIENVDIEFWPVFFPEKIPLIGNRVEVIAN